MRQAALHGEVSERGTLIALERDTAWSAQRCTQRARLRSVDLTDPERLLVRVATLPARDYTGLSLAGEHVQLGVREPGTRSELARPADADWAFASADLLHGAPPRD